VCRLYTVPGQLAEAAAEEGAPEGARVIVGGCSMVGSHLGYTLSMEGHRVTIIDEDPGLFKRLPPGYSGNFLEGVVYDEETLLAAGITDADAFVSVTKKDNKNLMAAEVARHVFGVPHVMARLFNPDKEPTYQALRMPFVCGTTLLAQALLERILAPAVRTKAACLFNRYNLVEFESPAAWDGKTARRAMEDAGVSFAYIVRRSTGYMPEDNFLLKKGDTVNALVTTKRLIRLDKSLRKMTKG
jgi:trk system potassium uptake protein TrkA